MTTFYPVYDLQKILLEIRNGRLSSLERDQNYLNYELSKGRAMIQDSDVFVYENENMKRGFQIF